MRDEKLRATRLVEDLSVLARRAALSAAEKRALADALGSSATLATAHRVGLDFDRAAAVQPNDDAMIGAAVSRALGRNARGARRKRLPALLLVAALLVAGSATAWWQRATLFITYNVAAPAHRVASDARPLGSVAVLQPRIASTLSQAQPSANGAQQPVGTTNEGARPRARRAEVPFDSAQVLFREANAARLAGELSLARALYLRLQRDFPSSDEALLAHVSLGNLLLSMGRPREAEQQFSAYPSGHQPLELEAIVGRARSLAALGRAADERQSWEALLHANPTGVYAERARQRLSELERATIAPH